MRYKLHSLDRWLRKITIFRHKNLSVQKIALPLQPQFGALAHLVERNTGSVEVSGSSPLCSTTYNCLIRYTTAN